jgi:uncharacterized membrane protein
MLGPILTLSTFVISYVLVFKDEYENKDNIKAALGFWGALMAIVIVGLIVREVFAGLNLGLGGRW